MMVAIGIGLFIYAINAVIQAAAMDATEERTRALTVGLVFACSFLFASTSPTIAGAVAGAYGTPAVFLYSGSLITLSALLDFFLPMPR